jgi:hypothetical protein
VTSIYDYTYCLRELALCDGKTGEPILSLCCGARILEPYPFSMTGICMGFKDGMPCGTIDLKPTLEAHVAAQESA